MSSGVCELHFKQDDILRQTEFFHEKTGKKVIVPLSYPRLKNGAIPSLFPDGPSHLSSSVSSRESPKFKRRKRERDALEKAIDCSLAEKEEYERKQMFYNLDELKICLDTVTLPNDWIVIHRPIHTMILNISNDNHPRILKSLIIDCNLNISVAIRNVPIKSLNQDLIPSKINNLKDLLSILERVDLFVSNASSEDNIQHYLQILSELMMILKERIPHKSNEINFLLEQISNFNSEKQQYRYSADFLIFSTLLHTISPHAYNFIRNSENIIMPHSRTIQKIFSDFNIHPINEQFNQKFLSYIKFKFQELSEKDLPVILMIDEIHLNQAFDYKGGNLCGMAYNCKSAASSAYVFMIRSLLSVYKDVVHILPVKTLSADNLHIYIKKIVVGLENIGFKIIAVVTDNNSINKKAMSVFSEPPKVSVYPNPVDKSRPLFFIIDTVHILKCIRNNWVNQKNNNQSMFFPSFDDASHIETASFSCIKKLHEFETGKLLKYAYGLTIKALYPTNLEKQSVKLALQIFNDNVVEALFSFGQQKEIINFQETGNFIKIINTWWSIVNVKSIFKGVHKNNIFETPFTVADNDEKYVFMNKFLNWLDSWKNLNLTSGFLTKETHFAVSHTTYALIEMSNYCINELGFKYLLLGKIQTDTLEARFGKYRQLAGAHHNISIRQVYEIEDKLRLQSTLPTLINSSKFGKIPLHISDFKDTEEQAFDDIDVQTFMDDITVDDSDIHNIKLDIPILTYIAGYCCYNILKKFKCDVCKSSITIDKELAFENDENIHSWIKVFDRGLLYPHPDILHAVIYNFIVVKKLISDDYEQKFLFSANPRVTVCKITLNLLHENFF